MTQDVLSKQDGFLLLTKAYQDALSSIEKHPPQVSRVFNNAWNAFRGPAKRIPWVLSANLSESEIEVVHGLLFASAFMSAWYDLQGEKTKRDEVAQNGAMLVRVVGLSHEDAFKEVLEAEKFLRADLKRSIGKRGLFSRLFGS